MFNALTNNSSIHIMAITRVTTKLGLFAVLLFGRFAFAGSCYQGAIGNANVENYSAADAKITIMFAGPGKTSAIAFGVPSQGRKGRVNGEFDAGSLDKKKNEIHATLVPNTGEIILHVDGNGSLIDVQPRGKFMANKKTDDSINGVVGTTFGDWGAKIELKSVSLDECRKALYGDVKATPAAPSASAPTTTSTSPAGS